MSAIRRFTPPVTLALFVCATLAAVPRSAQGDPDLAWASIAGNNGSWETAVKTTAGEKDKIHIRYTPDPKKVGVCTAIYLVQTVKRKDQGGNTIEPKNVDAGALSHAQDDMTAGGTTVDHLKTEKDPYYNGNDAKKDSTSKGSSDGNTVGVVTGMSDAPYWPDDWFPAGVTKVTLCFEVCAVCGDNGKILDCITWTYTRTKGDPNYGVIADAAAAAAPSDEFKKAKEKFEKNHKDGTVCPEAVAEVHKGEKNITVGVHDLLPYFPHPGQPTQCLVDIVNSSGQPVGGIQWQARDQTTNQFLGQGTIPILNFWSYQTIQFQIPPIPQAPSTGRSGTQAVATPHVICVTVDPAGSIPEYDETDNVDCFQLGPDGISGVGDGARLPDYNRIVISPNPFRSRTSMRFAMRQAGEARVEVFDASGKRVRVLATGRLEAGVHDAEWDGRDATGRRAAAGAYVMRVTAEGASHASKVILLK